MASVLALWSTFVMVGRARCLWQLAVEHLPVQGALFEAYASGVEAARDDAGLIRLYQRIARADFSRDVLHKAQGLRAVTLKPCGWSDWGTQQRVLDSLRGSDGYSAFVRRLNRHARVNVQLDGFDRRRRWRAPSRNEGAGAEPMMRGCDDGLAPDGSCDNH